MATTIVSQDDQPISRTYQYRKVMKPMLERKRRARINRCLDELKELLVGALQSEGESVSRLEKADVLELTVRHLHKLRRNQKLVESTSTEKFRAGFVHCANEVNKYLGTLQNPIDGTINSRLLGHLDTCIRSIAQNEPNNFIPSGSSSPSSQSMYPCLPQLSPSSVTGVYTPPSSPNSNKLIVVPKSSSPSTPNGFYTYASYNDFLSSGGNSQPLSLCMKQEEPYDLSGSSVWRPW